MLEWNMMMTLARRVLTVGAILAMAAPRFGGAAETDETPPVPKTYEAAMALIRDAEERKRGSPSRSVGAVDGGSLENPAVLPFEGYGFVIGTRRHRARDLRYGTDALVFGLAEVAATLANGHPGAPRLVIGNLGQRNGGAITYSYSHQNGRDVDLAFFVTDREGRPYEPADLVVIRSGKTLEGNEEGSGTVCRFDLARNWELVTALLTCRRFGARVEKFYLWDPLRERLLEQGRAWAAADAGTAERERREGLVKRAGALLSQPAYAGPHDDHLHLRIGE
jgi:penicillin-insensitive murein endopeptidase